ncbi:actin-related protein 2/3 complex subunit 2B isoform X1 [Brachypodium distachyon]|uniref:actin-related protein 2/3 complex subunit 2B isoform X1 n=1 Tax=Brachypodium distachyon TaxID=15368 RepID=UPI000D0D2346|nr:actin-related protein 2/3 complex subunit 2B isoform X1 [Brachypodium distachyon]|eukprot:XP_014750939.2 actin-related protein 2/3 complex subunit 2B isoform X1 [Brachypodium distachyon]
MSKSSCTITSPRPPTFIKGRPWILSSNSASAMAFFNSGSRALVEILTRLQSAETPIPVDHTFFEFGSIRYHIQASETDPDNIYLSISTPSLSHEALPATGLPEFTLQEARKLYHKFAEIVEPTKEGYALTLKLNFSGLTRPKDRAKATSQISRLQSVVLSSQLKDMLGRLGPSGTTKLVYNQSDPFFVSRMPAAPAGKISAIFPMRFRDDTDTAVAASFFQELQDVGNSFAGAPKCSWSPIPPPELRGELVQHLTTNGGFVSFDIFSRHVKGKRAAKTAWILLNFQAYVKYHIKCTRSYIQSRMRKREEILTEVIQNARLRGSADKKTLQVRKRSKRRRLFSLAKAWKLRKGVRAVIDGIKRLWLRIRVRALDRLRRQCRCFAVPRRKENKYVKLE